MKTWVAVAICAIGIACIILTLGSRNGPPRSLKDEFDERADRWLQWCDRNGPMAEGDDYFRRNDEFHNLVELGPDIIPFIFERWYRVPTTKRERAQRVDFLWYLALESLTGVLLPPDYSELKEEVLSRRPSPLGLMPDSSDEDIFSETNEGLKPRSMDDDPFPDEDLIFGESRDRHREVWWEWRQNLRNQENVAKP